jgi:hypothetical protein
MRKTLRSITVAGLVALLVVAGVGTAFALETTDEPDLETVKENVVDRLTDRIDRINDRIEELGESDDPRAEMLAEALTEAVAGYEAAIVAIPGAATVEEVRTIVREANEGLRDLSRVRRGYAHVAGDLEKFGRRLNALQVAIERAENAGADVTRAVAHVGAAADDLAEAQRIFDAIDPSMTGEELVETIKEAHGKAHEAQRHIRSGFSALRDALFGNESS